MKPASGKIDSENRSALLGQRPLVVWFTGLSGSGKSTLAMALESRLFEKGFKTFMLDGDQLRAGLNRDLGFDPASRSENIRRAGEVAALLADAGLIVLAAFISPYRTDRKLVREKVGTHRFMEVHVECPLEVCAERDVKGLYRAAGTGAVKDMTGIQAPYETPESPDLVLRTSIETIDECLQALSTFVLPRVVRSVQE